MRCSSRLRIRGRPGRSRAVSTVAGAIFFAVIMILVIFGLVVWSIQVQRRLSDLEARRLSQDLAITVEFIEGPPKAVNITVLNNGPEAVELVSLWITNDTYHRRIDLSGQEVVLRPGEEWSYAVGLSWKPGATYVIKVVTSLGRVFSTSARAGP